MLEKPQSMAGKVVKNTGLGILFKLMLMLLTFINRSVFIYALNEDFLGISGLYTNILSVLALADLGVNTVLMYFLYEPLAKQDNKRLAALIGSFRKIYRVIAGAVFAVGIAFVPFLPFIIHDSTLSRHQLTVYYILYLINAACSYLAVYKSTLLLADQKAYLVNFITFVVSAVQNLGYIVVLLATHNYTLYLCVMIAGTLATNLILTFVTNRQYSFLQKIKPEAISRPVRDKIYSSIKSVFLYRVGGTIMNSTDNILISILVNTAAVGFYSNYVLITGNVMLLLNFFSQAVMTSMGNYNVGADREKQERLFRTVQLIYWGIAAFAASCLLTMMNDFMHWWIRDDKYILGQGFVVVLAVKLFVDIITSPNWMFREASGLFREVRNIMMWAAGVNIVLSVILGKTNGLAGIVIATSIAKLVTLFWYEPRTFYHKVFEKPLLRYWSYQARLFLMAAVSVIFCCGCAVFLPGGLFGCLVKIAVCGILTGIIFIVFAIRTQEGRFLLQITARFYPKRQ